MAGSIKPSPLTSAFDRWEHELRDDKDKQFLLDGIANGFCITSSPHSFEPVFENNYKSATDDNIASRVQAQIVEEVEQGNYVICGSKPTIVSSLGAVEKSSGGVRLIHDCSRPEKYSLNSHAQTSKFKYETVDKAASLLPPNGYLAKIDLRSAYRVVPVHNACLPATGLSWCFDGSSVATFMVDCRLPFGASLSPEIFQRLSSSVTRMMARRGFTVIAYLDDFLVIASTERECREGYDILIALLQDLGWIINWDKVVLPAQQVTFLGISIDSVSRSLSLPDGKLIELQNELSHWSTKKKATKAELQSLIGKLNWAARVVKGGRTFLRRLIDIMITLKKKSHRIRLNANARADITWWVNFMEVFNGTVHFICDTPVPSTMFSSDACSNGGAAVFDNDWFYANWQVDYPNVYEQHINIKELYSVLLAARRWASAWQDKHLVVYTDSMVTMYMLNKGSSKNVFAMQCLRELFWISAVHNFHLSARHISGVDNIDSDFISRLDEHLDWFCVNMCDCLNMNHMSVGTFLYLQTLVRCNGLLYSTNVNNLRNLPMRNLPSPAMLPCVMPTSGFASTLPGHPSRHHKPP